MISIDPTQAQYLAVLGLVYDIAGALMLSRALIWSRPEDLAKQQDVRWFGNSALLRELCKQTTDSQWGAFFLAFGFAIQAMSALGIKTHAIIIGLLGLAFIGLLLLYACRRDSLVRARYMAAVERMSGDDEDKRLMKEAYGS
jgi:hypothetical protein